MSVLIILFYFFQIVILGYFFFPLILFVIKSKGDSPADPSDIVSMEADYAIIVTAYQQVGNLSAVVDSILKVNYKRYLVYVVADNCDISILNFNSDNVILLRPEETLSSNIKSHFYAINHFKRKHDRLTIIDSDNLVDQQYLIELNRMFDLGFSAVQGVREAKNLNTIYAALDAGGDIYYRYTDRKLLFEANSSASLAGSGMAFSVELYRQCLENYIQSSGAGFDKILQYEILKRNLRIAFSERAIVYDEKTAKSDQLVKQRARWINTWFKFFKLGLRLGVLGIRYLRINQILFSIMLVRPPLFLMLFVSAVSFFIDLFLFPILSIFWLLGGISFVSVFFISLKHFEADDIIYRSLKSSPKFILLQVIALFKAKKANTLSVATVHENNISLSEMQAKSKNDEPKN